MEFHPYCLLFPEMDAASLNDLAESIRKNGQLEPIVEHEGKILDGRHRYLACKQIGKEPWITAFQGTDPLAFVLAHNLDRRHMTATERAWIADELANMPQHRPGDKSAVPRTSQTEAAAKFDVGLRTVQDVARVKRTGVQELKDAVRTGRVSADAGAKVASLPEEKQRALLDAVEPDRLGKKAKEEREAMKALPSPPTMPSASSENSSPAENPPALIKPASINVGMDVAYIAIQQLKRIGDKDVSHIPALESVIKYCQEKISTLRK